MSVALAAAGASSTTGCTCPAALLAGVVAEQDGELVVISDGSGRAAHVLWPAGQDLRRDDGVLVLVDLFGRITIRPGDHVRLGGGATIPGDERFVVCGPMTVV